MCEVTNDTHRGLWKTATDNGVIPLSLELLKLVSQSRKDLHGHSKRSGTT
jgi:hypothetical protein